MCPVFIWSSFCPQTSTITFFRKEQSLIVVSVGLSSFNIRFIGFHVCAQSKYFRFLQELLSPQSSDKTGTGNHFDRIQLDSLRQKPRPVSRALLFKSPICPSLGRGWPSQDNTVSPPASLPYRRLPAPLVRLHHTNSQPKRKGWHRNFSNFSKTKVTSPALKSL